MTNRLQAHNTDNARIQLAVESNCFAPDWWSKGVANYARHILDRLCSDCGLSPSCFSKTFHPLAETELPANCKLQVVSGKSGLWRNTALRSLAHDAGANVAWFPFHVVPWMRTPIPFVTTVHDLSFMIKPGQSTDIKTIGYFTLALMNALWRSRKILAISQTTANDIVRYFPWAKSKIRVAKHGLPDDCRGLGDLLLRSGGLAREKVIIAKVLFLDGGNQRKRLDLALKACASLANDWPLQLTITGNPNHAAYICRRTLGKVPSFVRLVGLLPRAELLQEMASSNVLTYLSHYEGFGFPIIEGMSLGAQVVALDGRAEKEVGGKLAIYSKSELPSDLAQAIAQGISDSFDPGKSSDIIAHARSFSWDESARVHLEAFQQALQKSK